MEENKAIKCAGSVLALLVIAGLNACAANDRESMVYGDESSVPAVTARVETVPVPSRDDAADDPAIWRHPTDPGASLILGTDKQAGLGVYDLSGELKQFLAAGEPNNVDLRQGVRAGNWRGDLAAASNRAGDVVTLFAVDAQGARIVGEFPAGLPEPYGSCMGIAGGEPLVFVTYKTGEVRAHRISGIEAGNISQQAFDVLRFDSQLEGCVFDDAEGRLYVGEEGRGVWQASLAAGGGEIAFTEARLIDEVDAASGLAADVEGMSLAEGPDGKYLILSSQGNDSYAVYSAGPEPAFLGRFRITRNPATGIDGAQETDGLAVMAAPLGEQYPAGLLVVQDGFNAPAGSAQNFKLVDWREVTGALELEAPRSAP